MANSAPIAILGAMREEIEPIISKLENLQEISYAKNSYFKGSYEGRELVVAYSKIGKVFSALSATVLIEHFGCKKVIFSGVAGAINSQYKIGDLVVASKVAQHDLDITAFGHPMGYVPEGSVYIQTSSALREVAKEVADELGHHLHEGVIVTGDQFVASNERKEEILSHFEADALEMEGASVAVVCDAYGVELCLFRAISDSADMDADFDFDAFLEKSAKVSADFVLKMIAKL